jgi:protein SCO1/2
MKTRHIIYLALATAAFSVGIFAAQHLLKDPIAEAGTTMTATNNNDFTLTQNNQAVHLHDFRGKLALIYFGYASCPDVCPTSLALISSALKELSPEENAKLQPIFISVDPERDNGTKLMEYARYFYPTFVGITGTEQEIQRAAMQYGAFYSKVQSSSAMGYTVDHSSNSYLVGKEGQLLTTFKHDVTKAEMVSALRAALQN